MARKQLNIGLSQEQYEAVKEAAAAEEVTVTAYCRDAILTRAMPEPEPDPELLAVGALPAWLLHVLLVLTRSRARPG